MVRRGLLATVALGWRDALTAASRAPLPVVLATAAFFALSFVPDGSAAGTTPQTRWLVPGLADVLRVLVAVIVQASLAVPIYRVLLDPGAAIGRFDIKIVARYAVWLLLLSGWSGLEAVATGAGWPASNLGQVALTAVRLAIFYVGIRLILVFPLVALDRDRHPTTASWRLTRGRFWWLLIGSALNVLPFLILTLIQAVAVMHLEHRSFLQAAVTEPHWLGALTAMLYTLTQTGFVARVYADWTALRAGTIER